jgi:hypothetical protein
LWENGKERKTREQKLQPMEEQLTKAKEVQASIDERFQIALTK